MPAAKPRRGHVAGKRTGHFFANLLDSLAGAGRMWIPDIGEGCPKTDSPGRAKHAR